MAKPLEGEIQPNCMFAAVSAGVPLSHMALVCYGQTLMRITRREAVALCAIPQRRRYD